MAVDLKQYEKMPVWAADQPVARVYWIPVGMIEANDYNPNVVAPPEMELLELSIREDGFTQPIVVWHREDGRFEVVDGFHRSKVGRKLGLSHLPCVVLNRNEEERNDRIASTIRHNRARGTHNVELMSEIVAELTRAQMSDQWIMRHIGMDRDELLRLKQITGLAALFADREFSLGDADEEAVGETAEALLQP